MISVTEHRVALMNLRVTLEEVCKIDALIKHFRMAGVGPAYLEVKYVNPELSAIQLDRQNLIEALIWQRQKLVDYLAAMGIDYDIEE